MIDNLLKQYSLYRYFQINNEKELFSSLTQLDFDSVDDYITYIKEKNLAIRSYSKDYLQSRFRTEKTMYEQFVKKGGKPQVKHPFYFTLGRCDGWFYKIKHCFGSIVFRLNEFDPSVLSFTYGDSIPTFLEMFQDGKEYRNQVYTLHEISELIEKYGMPNEWNELEKYGPENYIEVQVWTENFTSIFDGLCHTLSDISIFELSTRLIHGSLNIPDYVVFQKPAQYYFEKCYANKHWPWFRSLLTNTSADSFCDDIVHGRSHAFKCALLAFALASELELDCLELKTIVYAALFHDIGRKHYCGGMKHGLIGSRIVDKYIDPNDNVVVDKLKDAIAKHDTDSANNNNFLIWLKDIDSLDYLRLGMGEYDTRYIKTTIAKSMVRFSIELNILAYKDDLFFERLIEERHA